MFCVARVLLPRRKRSSSRIETAALIVSLLLCSYYLQRISSAHFSGFEIIEDTLALCSKYPHYPNWNIDTCNIFTSTGVS